MTTRTEELHLLLGQVHSAIDWMDTRNALKDLIELLIEDTRWAPQRSDTPLTTESPTTVVPSVVAELTHPTMNPLWHHLGIHEMELSTHVAQCSSCRDRVEALLGPLLTPAQDAPEMGVEWIFPKLASGEFAKEPEAVKFELPLFTCLDKLQHTGHAWSRLSVNGIDRESFYCMGVPSETS